MYVSMYVHMYVRHVCARSSKLRLFLLLIAECVQVNRGHLPISSYGLSGGKSNQDLDCFQWHKHRRQCVVLWYAGTFSLSCWTLTPGYRGNAGRKCGSVVEMQATPILGTANHATDGSQLFMAQEPMSDLFPLSYLPSPSTSSLPFLFLPANQGTNRSATDHCDSVRSSSARHCIRHQVCGIKIRKPIVLAVSRSFVTLDE